ncbi:microsomal glutathione S-transferase 1-like isoform X1 [Musca domestica]|uniref:Microsomal glutathione S-transferase 1 n=1 Tax=Musca domestica TaxID=7370 RepID=A0ABM3VJ04_MUSDO|nr:microsomal glutathione S-transferase 1-like isoform X1 [Musca domestica]XP_058985775.1 microsomal glutathione S-transferase 1-like isoform X1 [Musca domestica]
MDAATISSMPNNKSTPSGGFSLLNLENRVFCCFLLWTSVLVGKMLLMSMLTALQRFRNKILGLMPHSLLKKVFPNQEDLFFKNIEVAFNDPHVERVRRAHRNDMENILPYFTMALLYICTDPNPTIACNLFRVASVARIIHTLVYAFRPVPQPSRFLAFFVMFLITIYMAIVVGFENLKYI